MAHMLRIANAAKKAKKVESDVYMLFLININLAVFVIFFYE